MFVKSPVIQISNLVLEWFLYILLYIINNLNPFFELIVYIKGICLRVCVNTYLFIHRQEVDACRIIALKIC